MNQLITVFLGLLVIGLAAFSHSFTIPFQLDDIPIIVENPIVRFSLGLQEIFRYDPSRCLTHLSFFWNHRLAGFDVRGFHIVNFMIHVLNAFLLCLFLFRMTGALGYARSTGKWIAFFGAAIFLVHPLQTESVSYIVQRSTLLAVLFYLSAMLMYMRLRLNFRWGLYVLYLFVLILGTMTKPIFVTLPLILLVYEHFFPRQKGGRFFLMLPLGGVLLIVPFFVMLFNLHYNGESFHLANIGYATRVTSVISRTEYLFTQFNVLVTYLRLLFIPIHQNILYIFPLSQTFFEIKTVISFFILIGLLGLGLWMARSRPFISFHIFWFFILMIPESSVFPIPNVIFEHRLYLAVGCFGAILAAVVVEKVPVWRAVLYLGCFVLSLSMLTYARNLVWNDPVWLLEDSRALAPNSAQPYYALGGLYRRLGLTESAKTEFRRAVELDPQFLFAYNQLGEIYAKQKKYEAADQEFKKAVRLDNNYWEAHFNLGDVYLHLGQSEWALAEFQKVIEIKPNVSLAYVRIGTLYEAHGASAKAEQYYLSAIDKNPFSVEGHYVLGNFYLEQKQYDRAIRMYEKVVSINPYYAGAYNTLGIAYVYQGDSPKAEKFFQTALQLNPHDAMIYLNLAQLYQNRGDMEKAAYFSGLAQSSKKKP